MPIANGLMNQPDKKNRTRFYEIDLLRFGCAVAVVFYHYVFRYPVIREDTEFVFPVLSEFSKYGYFGFHLFFMISGFVILMSVAGKGSSDFAISRTTRLYPAYWASVTLTFIVILFAGAPKYSATLLQYLVNLTMLQEFVDVKLIDGVYWTLAVELRFYFLIFMAILFGQTHRIGTLLCAWILASIAIKALAIPYLGFFLFPEWSHYFIAGAMFYLMHRDGPSKFNASVIAMCFSLSLWEVIDNFEKLKETYGESSFSIVIVVLLVIVCYLVFLLLSLNKLRFLRRKEFMMLGVLTYPLYLVHQKIGYIIFDRFQGNVHRYLLLASTLAAAILLSYCISRFIEKKFSSPMNSGLHAMFGRMQKRFAKSDSEAGTE